MDKKNKILLSLLTFIISVGSIYGVPTDPNSFYGDVTVNNKIVDDSILNIYLNDVLFTTKDIINSKYGAGFDKAVITGEQNDRIRFEFVSNNCASSSQGVFETFVVGKTQRLDLDFSGINTCNDDTTNSNSGGGSSGGGGSSSGGGSSGGSSGGSTNSGTEFNLTNSEPQLVENSTTNNQNSQDSTPRKTALIQTTQSETSKGVEDIEVITTDSSNSITSDVEIKKEPISNSLGGNIIANNKTSMAGIIFLILLIIGFIIWRENKKRKLRNK